jgi:pyruvate,orthophosphate dikinase
MTRDAVTADDRSAGRPLVVTLDGSAPDDRDLLGGKAFGLQRMHRLGAPVPPAFALTTRACEDYLSDGLSDPLWELVLDHLSALEARVGARFGGSPPLLVSVRSGSPVSMPGMMDTVLGVGATRFPYGELRSAIGRVFESWHGARARTYRRANAIPETLGTAVVVQAMVFGDLDERSGTGVHLTRDPITGEPVPYGEWLAQARGERLVSGVCTPQPIEVLARDLPQVYEQLVEWGRRLDSHFGKALEIEFTVQSGALHLLQMRASTGSPEPTARRDAPATTQHAVGTPLRTGIGVSAGVATGLVVDDADEAVDLAETGVAVILARPTTSVHDINGFLAATGVVTERGGSTSHAAVVARQLGLPCVVGCGEGMVAALRGRLVTIDGATGKVHGATHPSAATTITSKETT